MNHLQKKNESGTTSDSTQKDLVPSDTSIKTALSKTAVFAGAAAVAYAHISSGLPATAPSQTNSHIERVDPSLSATDKPKILDLGDVHISFESSHDHTVKYHNEDGGEIFSQDHNEFSFEFDTDGDDDEEDEAPSTENIDNDHDPDLDEPADAEYDPIVEDSDYCEGNSEFFPCGSLKKVKSFFSDLYDNFMYFLLFPTVFVFQLFFRVLNKLFVTEAMRRKYRANMQKAESLRRIHDENVAKFVTGKVRLGIISICLDLSVEAENAATGECIDIPMETVLSSAGFSDRVQQAAAMYCNKMYTEPDIGTAWREFFALLIRNFSIHSLMEPYSYEEDCIDRCLFHECCSSVFGNAIFVDDDHKFCAADLLESYRFAGAVTRLNSCLPVSYQNCSLSELFAHLIVRTYNERLYNALAVVFPFLKRIND